MKKLVIGVLGECIQEAEVYALSLGAELFEKNWSNTLYVAGDIMYDCRAYLLKSGTPRWNGIIFLCDKSADSDRTADWLNSLL